MPKIRHELRIFAKVRFTKPWLATVFMDVYVEHANLMAEHDLHCLSYRRWTHHRTHREIAKVVIVGHRVKIVREHDPT